MRIVIKIVVFVILAFAMWSCGNQEKATYHYPSSFYRGIELTSGEYVDKPYVATHKRDSQNVTISWHPYYLEDGIRNYDFSLLSTVVFHGYEWEGDYTEKVIDTWYETELVEKAHAKGCKVLFSVSNYGALRSKQFFDSTALQQDFMDEVLAYLKMKDADGVELDFPAVLSSNHDELTRFIKRFSIRLKQYNPQSELYVSLPFIDENNAFDIKEIQPYVNLFILGGNNYANFNYAELDNEPISPIQNPYNDSASIAMSYKHYTGKGINPFQVILELPLFTTIKESRKKSQEEMATERMAREKMAKELGQTKEIKIDSIEYYNELLAYQQIRKKYAAQDVFYDKTAMSSYMNIPNPKGSGDYRIYFDDSMSLGAKYDWALNNGFRGVGLWSLGYDNGYHELWRMLDSRTHKVAAIEAAKSPFSVGSYFARNYDLFRVWFTLIVGLVFLAAVIGMLHWKSRDSLTDLQTFKLYFLIIGAFIFFFVLVKLNILTITPIMIVIIGIILGALMTYFINMYLNRRIELEP